MKSTSAMVMTLGLIVSAVIGCSSSSSSPAMGPCNENPWECPAGQTCWPNSLDGTYACLNSGPGVQGSACQNSVGTATCGDGLSCFGTSASGGVCTAYCDNTNPSHGCPSGLACESVFSLSSGQAQFHACAGGLVGPPGGGDAGTPGTADSGASGDASGDATTGVTGSPDSGAADGSSSKVDSSTAADSGPDSALLTTGH